MVRVKVHDADDPGRGVVSALLEYRVKRLEEVVEKVQKEQIEQGRKLDDMPGFISRKFDEQKHELKNDHRGNISLVATVIAALSSLAILFGAIAPLMAHK